MGTRLRRSPTLTVSIDGFGQRLPFGSASVFYSENVGVAGGFGGPTDNKTISGTLVVSTLRDLIVIFNPALTKAESLSDRQIERVDVSVFTLGFGAAYRLSPSITIFGGYSFLLQRVGHFSTTQDFDGDQNRVKVGLQFGYPFALHMGK